MGFLFPLWMLKIIVYFNIECKLFDETQHVEKEEHIIFLSVWGWNTTSLIKSHPILLVCYYIDISHQIMI